MSMLARAGIIEPLQERDTDGRFRPGRYLLHIDDLVTAASAPAPPRARHRATPTVAPAQLSLLTSA